MKYIIDRFVDDYAVCEDENKQMVNIPIKELPANIKEGDCLIYENGVYTVDSNWADARKKRIRDKMDDIFR